MILTDEMREMIRTARKKEGLAQEEFIRLLGLKRQCNYSYYERENRSGKIQRIPDELFDKIATLLNLDRNQFAE